MLKKCCIPSKQSKTIKLASIFNDSPILQAVIPYLDMQSILSNMHHDIFHGINTMLASPTLVAHTSHEQVLKSK